MADDDWKDMGAVWQDKKSDVDISALAKNIEKKTRLMRFCFFAEAAICVFGIGWGISWMFGRGHETAQVGVGLAFFIFSVVGLYLAWWSRKDAWHAASGTPLEELKSARKRAQAGVRYAVVNLWFITPGFFLMVYTLWSVWHSSDKTPADETRVIATAAVFSIALVTTFLWALWYRKKRLREVTALDQVIREMEE
ncbi:MAG: hypothetical protein AB3N28_13780 [Kordiimonas sp.]